MICTLAGIAAALLFVLAIGLAKAAARPVPTPDGVADANVD